jgi:hypothetical protein
MDTTRVFKALNDELGKRNATREFYICGAAAMIAMKIIRRATEDVDVLKPVIDSELKAAAESVASNLQMNSNWLNNGPIALSEELPESWEDRCIEVFLGSHLHIRSVGRSDLICMKLYAACCRMDDVPDLVALKPSDLELAGAKVWTLDRDGSEIWPRIVDECLAEVRRRLGYEK